MSWEKWRQAVIKEMRDIGYEDPETDFDDEAWREFYDEDFSPEDAVFFSGRCCL